MTRPWRAVAALMAVALAAVFAGASAHAVDETAINAAKPPRMLSQYGFFTDLAAQVPAGRVLPFEPSTQLFTDHARKMRFVYVPTGAAAVYGDREAFAFPVGSALVKTFAYPSVPGDPASPPRLIETRVLARQSDGWAASAYVWNEEQTDAKLALAGKTLALVATTEGGETVDVTYRVPNRNQCKGCHEVGGEVAPIGPKARNLNHAFAYSDGPQNQIAGWADAGILTAVPTLDSVPAMPDAFDPDAPLNARARAWLDINCAHCHRADGPASNSGLFLGWNVDDPVALGIGKRPVAAGRAARGGTYDIEPGNPDASILLLRVESSEPGVMMPELGRSVTDDRAVELLREWIAQID
ncbi:SO2930 family diheme c-type cytochrome [Oricola sp.]|uniref:SO2930 family diheme c-type cytochrome n=1 Tax=Oricola sp. TaxID=1979950 RepID=UPI003BA8A258